MPVDAMAGIGDVARKAGVSTATVSRAFNKPDLVNADTRKKVQDAAQALNYRANHSARNLRGSVRGRPAPALTHVIGYLTDRRSVLHGDPFAYEMLQAVEAALCERGLGIRVIPANPDGALPREVADREVDGIICRFSAPLVCHIASRVPTVTLDAVDADSPCYSVVPDYAGGLRLVVDRLAAAGLADVALLADDPRLVETSNFWHLFPLTVEQALRHHGRPVPPRLCRGAAYDPRSGYEAGIRLFRRREERPRAVIGPDGAMLGLYRAAAECGVRIPDDVSVIGVNGLRHGEYLHPGLTTLDVQPSRMSAAAVSILADSIASGSSRRGVEIIPVVLRERESARF